MISSDEPANEDCTYFNDSITFQRVMIFKMKFSTYVSGQCIRFEYVMHYKISVKLSTNERMLEKQQLVNLTFDIFVEIAMYTKTGWPQCSALYTWC